MSARVPHLSRRRLQLHQIISDSALDNHHDIAIIADRRCSTRGNYTGRVLTATESSRSRVTKYAASW